MCELFTEQKEALVQRLVRVCSWSDRLVVCHVDDRYQPSALICHGPSLGTAMKCNCPINDSLVADTASESALVDDVEMFPPSSVTSSPPLWTSSPPASITSPLRTVGKIRTGVWWCSVAL